MDADLTALARALVALPRWDLRPGVYPRDADGILWTEDDIPDLLDPATGGVLLDRLGPGWTLRRTPTGYTLRLDGPMGYACTEQSAGICVARAMVARWMA